MESLAPLDELVVVDDGSTDETSQLILEFADSDSRITLHKLAHHGLVHSLNAGLKLARNPWVARYDIDDLYPSDRLSHQIALTQNNENVGVIFSDYNIWKNGECFRGRIPSPLFHLQSKISLVNSQRTAHPLIHNFDELISSYDGYPLAEVRKYLFCYDYLTWLGNTHDSNVLQMEKKIVKKLRQAQMSAILSFDTVRFGSQSFRRKFERLLER